MILSENLTNSRTGLMLRAMRDLSEAATSLGVDLQWLRTRVFILSALFGSLAGNLFAHYTSFVSVQSFTVEKSFTFLLISVLGGVRSPWGAAIGAVFITIAPEYLSRLGDFHQILFGIRPGRHCRVPSLRIGRSDHPCSRLVSGPQKGRTC